MLSLSEIAKEVNVCQKCPLYKNRTKAVPGEGPDNAKVMFIGEGPGAEEDRQGRPFCGAAGKFLDELLVVASLGRDQVFIGNLVKCRPPQNRDPEPAEIATCTENYLKNQIKLLNPKIIVTLGRHSLNYFFPERRISADHGKAIRRDDQIYFFSYHPAVALYTNSMRQTLINDFKKLKKLLRVRG